MHEIVAVRVRYGFRRVLVMLHRQGVQIGKTAAYRLYREEQLMLRSKRPKRRRMVVQRHRRYVPQAVNQAWSLDFVADQLTNGQKIRALTIVDVFTREAVAIRVGHRLRGEDVVATLNQVIRERAVPKVLFADNGSEFSGRMLDLWAYHHKVRIDFSRPGKPTDNAFVETFNGSLRDECLNVHWFESLLDAQQKIEAWRQEYNESRPHMALENRTPSDFALYCRETRMSVNEKSPEDSR
jgi:putative transposase